MSTTSGSSSTSFDSYARKVAPGPLGRRAAAEPDVEHPACLRSVGEGQLEIVGVAEARPVRIVEEHPALERAVEAEVAAGVVVDDGDAVVLRVLGLDDLVASSATPRSRRCGPRETAAGTPATSSEAARRRPSRPFRGRARRPLRRLLRRARGRAQTQSQASRPAPPRRRPGRGQSQPTPGPDRCRARGSARTT